MDKLNYAQVREMLISCTDRIIRCEPYLTKVDSAIGDGDHGIGMKNGMKAAQKSLIADESGTNIYSLYTHMGEAMEKAMGGASGMIFSTLFTGDAKIRKPASEITPSMFADQMAAGLKAIQDLGHAKPGDKTMVDAMAPAVDAMKKNCTGSFSDMLIAAEKASKQGMEDTKKYMARFGRSKSLMERAIGHQDAGATSTWLIFLQMCDYVTGEHTPDPDIAGLCMEDDPDNGSSPDSGLSKKIINNPDDVVKEEAEGFLAAYGDRFAAVKNVNGLVKRSIPEGKTALVIGGGSGHEPMFAFFLGDNLADAAANGNVFASPDPTTIMETAMAAQRGAGVLFVYGNYAGDNLNFDKAAELLRAEGVQSKTVRVWDDVASAPKDRIIDRRGIAGDVFVIKIAGAVCSSADLNEAYRITSKARDNTFSIGVGLKGATIPGQKEPIFSLPAGEMEYGLGIHGEPGIKRINLESADEIVDHLLNVLLEDSKITSSDTVCTYINGLGSTTLMELMIMNRRLAERLHEKNIKVHDMDIGSLVTTMEMAGASITLMKLDDELQKYYDMPCDSPFYKKSGH